MAEKTLAQKLFIKPGYRVAVINAPAGYADLLLPLPEGVQISTHLDDQFDFVLIFANAKADVERFASSAINALKPNGLLWFAHPKKSSKIKTDVSRDVGWDAVTSAGYETVASISINDTWSGLRFKKV